MSHKHDRRTKHDAKGVTFYAFYACQGGLCVLCALCVVVSFSAIGGPSLKVHHCQHLASMSKQDTGGSPPGAACDSAEPPHGNFF
jgi:hypothetical protein